MITSPSTEQLVQIARSFESLGVVPWCCKAAGCCGGLTFKDAKGGYLFDYVDIDTIARIISARDCGTDEVIRAKYR